MDLYFILLLLVFVLFLLVYIRYLSPIIVTYTLIGSAKTPSKAYHKAACFDVYAIEDVTVPIHQWREIRTGVVFAPWPHIFIKWMNLTLTPFGNVVMSVKPRSGLAKKKGIKIHPGTIDSDYRGELTIIVYNDRDDYPIRFHEGDKIAQVQFDRVSSVYLFKVKKLSKSFRGTRGFGSSG